jgi:hypothetical protein
MASRSFCNSFGDSSKKIWQSSPSNRRITLIVQYIAKDGKDGDEDSAKPVPSSEREKPSAGQPKKIVPPGHQPPSIADAEG